MRRDDGGFVPTAREAGRHASAVAAGTDLHPLIGRRLGRTGNRLARRGAR